MLQIMHNTTCRFTGKPILLYKKHRQSFFFIQACVCYTLILISLTSHNLIAHYRHGLKQYRNGWADGPAYITQCPIQSGRSYTYDFNVTGQRGTLWWHAHILWLRATVYGAIVIMPTPGTPFPFPQPDREFEILQGQFECHYYILILKEYQGKKFARTDCVCMQ